MTTGHRLSTAFIIVAGFCLAACNPQNDDLPTLLPLPTQADTAVAVIGTLVPPTAPVLTALASSTPTASPSATDVPPSATLSSTPFVTPSATITETPTLTATLAPTLPPEDRPVTGLLELAARTTLLPGDFSVPAYEGINILLSPTADPNGLLPMGTVISPAGGNGIVTGIVPGINCAYYPPAAFGVVYANAPDLAVQLGCTINNPPDVLSVPSAWQPFQNGLMIWLSGDIYVLYNNGTSQFVADTFVAGSDLETLPDVAPPGLLVPVRGFAKVWSQAPGVKSALGFALSGETGVPASVLPFQNGLMAALQGRSDTLVIVGGRSAGTWRSVLGSP